MQGNLSDPGSLRSAFEGASTLFLLSPPGGDAIPHARNAVEAAGATGVTHVVKLSAAGSALDSPLQLGRWHAEAEEVIRTSGLDFTFLHPGSFMQNMLMTADSIRERGEFYSARGDGRRAMIDTRDIGAVAARVLSDPSRFSGQTLVLTGGAAVTDDEVADALGSALGRTVNHVRVPLEAVEEGMRASGLPDWLVADLLMLEGWTAQGILSEVSPAVEAVLGRPPRTIDDFARDYAAAFS